jgi:hypothetical protein
MSARGLVTVAAKGTATTANIGKHIFTILIYAARDILANVDDYNVSGHHLGGTRSRTHGRFVRPRSDKLISAASDTLGEP